MNDLATHLVERVIPEVPVPQWVCSLPFRLRYLCGYDRELCADVLGAFVGELRRSLAWRAKRTLSLKSVADGQTATITFVQRFDSGLRAPVCGVGVCFARAVGACARASSGECPCALPSTLHSRPAAVFRRV